MTTALINEIENWKLEAKLEDSSRYFYHIHLVERIMAGKRIYVIGRKGTGKTAISEHLSKINEKGVHSTKLSFKNFPFNKLYELQDQGYTPPNQYITLWKYVIYSSTCRLMVNNPTVDAESRQKLKELFNDDIEHALSDAVEKWTSTGFNLNVLGNGFGITHESSETANSRDWITRVNILEKFLLGQIGNEKYLIMFDELDEDYKDIGIENKYKQYTELLTGLFKAAQDIRAKFHAHKYFPIIFLRDDIYEILQDPDKTKWMDFKADLDWDEQSIKNLLAFRISKAISPDNDVLPFNDAWNKLFKPGFVQYGNKQQKGMHPFAYILRSSLLRPRDFILYLRICAEMSQEKGNSKISAEIVRASDTAFSNYLKSELRDEIHGIIPDIDRVLDLFTILRKQTIPISEFKQLFDEAVTNGLIKDKDYVYILQILFHFSIIGNQPRQVSHQVFKYKNKDARLNLQENIVVHRGLYRSLQIL